MHINFKLTCFGFESQAENKSCSQISGAFYPKQLLKVLGKSGANARLVGYKVGKCFCRNASFYDDMDKMVTTLGTVMLLCKYSMDNGLDALCEDFRELSQDEPANALTNCAGICWSLIMGRVEGFDQNTGQPANGTFPSPSPSPYQAQANGTYPPAAPSPYQPQVGNQYRAQIGDPWSTGLFDCQLDQTNAIMTTVFPCLTFGQIAEVLDEGETTCATGSFIYMLLTPALCSKYEHGTGTGFSFNL
ncbi:hypothetical protein POM88_047438 [Heracleum sosnowskyi]|uniref:Uncharacterized protein n=1 Tax=Heracleum sosnowskyi TaxID=360622 RepID=A0AAD8LZM7_9APIA|nr:hypothetical protein POM88_047438 [Heracleum sosnowskyi]